MMGGKHNFSPLLPLWQDCKKGGHDVLQLSTSHLYLLPTVCPSPSSFASGVWQASISPTTSLSPQQVIHPPPDQCSTTLSAPLIGHGRKQVQPITTVISFATARDELPPCRVHISHVLCPFLPLLFCLYSRLCANKTSFPLLTSTSTIAPAALLPGEHPAPVERQAREEASFSSSKFIRQFGC